VLCSGIPVLGPWIPNCSARESVEEDERREKRVKGGIEITFWTAC